MEETDQQLVRRILDGDLSALTLLFGRYEPAVFRYALSLVGTADDAEDVVQEAFIRAYRNLRSYQPARPFRPWLYRIVRNGAFNWRRKHRRTITGEAAAIFLEQQPDPTESAHETIERAELREAMQRSLGKLSVEYREPLVLYYVDDRSYAEISDILRLPINTVATRIRRAKERLKTIYQQEDNHGTQ